MKIKKIIIALLIISAMLPFFSVMQNNGLIVGTSTISPSESTSLSVENSSDIEI